jgi:hypothetical protein
MKIHRYFLLGSLIAILILSAGPAQAYSDLANRFILACRQYDTVFPPENWSNEDIRSAALEVLDGFESDGTNSWAVTFCLQALGHTRNQDDISRILVYEDRMTGSVLRALAGFPSPDAIECMIRNLDADRTSFRELAVTGLSSIDFNELDDSCGWVGKVLDALNQRRNIEPEPELVRLIEDAITGINAYDVE